jgi:hypothetical protein
MSLKDPQLHTKQQQRQAAGPAPTAPASSFEDEEDDDDEEEVASSTVAREGGGRGKGEEGDGSKMRLPRQPSYDYEFLVKKISQIYSQKKWDECCHHFQTLSLHCPMTPLLWIQYSHAAGQAVGVSEDDDNADNNSISKCNGSSSVTVQNDVLELALLEFPGSSVLHYARVLLVLGASFSSSSSVGSSSSHLESVLEQAMDAVGKGSHPHDPRINELYKIVLQQLLSSWKLWVVGRGQQQGDEVSDQASEGKGVSDRIQLCLREWARHCPPNCDVRDEALDMDGLVEYLQWRFHRQHQQDLGGEGEDPSSLPPEAARAILSTWLDEPRRDAFRYQQEVRGLEDDLFIALERLGMTDLPPTEGSGGYEDAWKLCDVATASAGMGLGDSDVAKVFVRYARHLMKRSRQHQEHEHNSDSNGLPAYHVALQVLERGIAECPTVELLWVHYIELLQQLINSSEEIGSQEDKEGAGAETRQEQRRQRLLTTLDTVLTRAVRNCPYSLRLATLRITSQLLLAHHGAAVVDPETLLSQANASLRSGFLTSSSGDAVVMVRTISDLFHSVLWVVKQRILSLLALANPGAVPIVNGGKQKEPPISALLNQLLNRDGAAPLLDVPEEAGDLIEDLNDLYEDMDKSAIQLLGQSQATGVLRSWLWRDGSHTLRLLSQPLTKLQDRNESMSAGSAAPGIINVVQSLKWTERALKMHNPPHPDLFRDYLQQIQNIPTTNVLQTLHLLRSTFSRAVRSVGRSVHHSQRYSPYDVSLRLLCQEWVEFESRWGSLESLQLAQQVTHKKLSSALTASEADTAAVGRAARAGAGSTFYRCAHASAVDAPPEALDEEPAAKRVKLADQPPDRLTNHPTEGQIPSKSPTESSTSPKKPVSHKVRVGKLDFPAHPYTVKVSNLTLDTEDMDLVDAFRRCGAIVHARIVRDKSQFHSHQGGRHHGGAAAPPSKGYGLVQFEERESVDAALALNDVIGLKERVVKVERSHIPATLIVPPGMHRVNQKGQGKYSKRNERRKEIVNASRDDAGSSRQDRLESDAAVETVGDRETHQNDPSVERPGASKPPPAQSMSILSFRPRGVGRGGHQKTRLVLPEPKKS